MNNIVVVLHPMTKDKFQPQLKMNVIHPSVFTH